jgi:hypothetical protein
VARNPFWRPHNPDRPAPGGIDGVRTDYVRWYPPDTPFHWGQGFNHPFTNVPAINGGRWINEFLPDKEYEVPAFISQLAYLFPVAGGTSGSFQAQLVGGNARPTTAQRTALLMDAHATALQQLAPAPLDSMAGGFARS